MEAYIVTSPSNSFGKQESFLQKNKWMQYVSNNSRIIRKTSTFLIRFNWIWAADSISSMQAGQNAVQECQNVVQDG